MPFVAECTPNDQSNWQRIMSLDLSDSELLELRRTHAFRCPDPQCHATVYLKLPIVARPHFAHKPGEESLQCLLRGGETPVHLAVKESLMNWVRNYDRYKGCEVIPEHILDNGEIRRVADVLAVLPNGELHVFEVQYSFQSIQEFEQRTRDYFDLGATNVLWFVESEKIRGPMADWARTQWELGVFSIREEIISVA